MKINLISIPVIDQSHALTFYTEKLGFTKKLDLPVGEYRWITLLAPHGTKEVELVIEPVAFEPARVYQQALYDAGIPITSFESENIVDEVSALKAKGVVFKSDIKVMGDYKIATFDDTCGNLICLTQVLNSI